MNAITFNDIFEKALERLPDRVSKGEPEFGNWRTSPLFDYETTYEKEQAVLEERSGISFPEIEEMNWPFETFRLNLVERDVPDDEKHEGSPNHVYKTRAVVHRMPDTRVIHMLVLFRQFDGSMPLIMLIRSEGTPDGKGFAQIYTPQSGWVQELGHVRLEGASLMAGSAVGSLGSFLIDVNLPTNHLVEVRPNQPGRSVEWVKARTHYTLITHGHPANKPMKSGARVPTDREGELKRGAHNRREHDRTYRHERFTYARGSTRRVRATWCGPKEWQDEGGKQIYRILEPVGGEPDCVLYR